MIEFEYLMLLILFVFTVFTARSGVRLIMVLGPISSIFIGFLIFESIEKFRKTKDEPRKMILGLDQAAKNPWLICNMDDNKRNRAKLRRKKKNKK